MTTAFDAEEHVAHMAKVMELDIAPEWRRGVIQNMAATATIAAVVLTFPLSDHDEPAPVFEP